MRIGYLDGPRLRRSLVAACEYAQGQRSELNRINVFPVPDGDTGTNLALTVRAIADRLRGNDDDDVSDVAREAAQAAVLGARGNCGMMLSHFLLGFSEHVRDQARITTEECGAALRNGVQNLHQALERPVEGTILTVMRDTAEAAERVRHRDFAELLQHLVEEARASLARTPDLLPVLRRAGVVDAGAKGFVSLLEGVVGYIHGDPAVVPVSGGVRSGATGCGEGEGAERSALPAFPECPERFRYCTEALVRGDALPAQRRVHEVLRERGDSLIVIRSGAVLKVHIHTDEPESVFAYLRGLGTLVTHKAEDMLAQRAAVARAAEAHVLLARRPVVVVTDSTADLSEEIVRAHGIHVTPLVLLDGDRPYRDGVDITPQEFHRRLTDPSFMPTTSQPAPADFLETFARAAEDGEAVLGVVVGSGLSGTYASAHAAAARFHGAPVHLVDSQGASLLTGLMVLKACELAEMAVPPEEIVERLNRMRDRSGVVITVDVFGRLLASGRIGRGRALLGSMLRLKPILGVDRAGKLFPVGKAFGRKRATRALLDAVARQIPDGARVRFGIVWVGEDDVVAPVSEMLRARYGRDVEILTAPATPVIATHTGLGAWGLAWLVED
ncbi:MAG TPA: DegV family protein [Longimicrobiales bacterium]|nr:DegV family protein [Longimicrobiales bacterium]